MVVDKTPPTATGIYRITNLINGKTYIGSARDLQARRRQHRGTLRVGKHHNPILQAAWNKHGESAFRFDVIALCEAECLIETEQHYIDLEQPVYNILRVAGRPVGRIVSEELRSKLRLAQIGRPVPDSRKAAISTALIGVRHTAERNAKQSARQTGLPGRPHTDTALEKIRAARAMQKMAPRSESTRRKIAASKTGSRHSQESIIRIAMAKAKLSPEVVRCIRIASRSGRIQQEIAGQFGVSRTTVKRIVGGLAYAWVI